MVTSSMLRHQFDMDNSTSKIRGNFIDHARRIHVERIPLIQCE